ncbi:MAG: hypothetical protein JJ858_12280 [Rhizobiaceae bacterium]|nr:hypothetical protein [Rhizobiaceae bacterium]
MGAEQTKKVEDLVLIDTLPFDEFELGLLAVLRHFSKSYTVPENQTWQHAYLIAAERWGERIGLSTAYALMKVIQAVSRCRPNGLHVQDPLCISARKHATEDEIALIGMLHHMRRDETPQARNFIQTLAYGRNDPAIVHAGLSFASRFSLGKRRSANSSAKHMLYVVG